jgi:hypothetical protein
MYPRYGMKAINILTTHVTKNPRISAVQKGPFLESTASLAIANPSAADFSSVITG